MILERLFIASGDESISEGSGKEISVLTATWESVALPALCLGLTFWLRHRDPFFIASQFPWIWLAPIFVALRHGSLGGILASLTILAGWSLSGTMTSLTPHEFPRGFFLGGIFSTFICGEFRDLWQAENRKQRKGKHLLSLHLEELASAHQTLAQSHDKLALDFIGHPPTLRDALSEIPRPNHGQLDEKTAKVFLTFLSSHFQIDRAAIHLMEDKGLKAVPLATLGQCRSLDGTEILIQSCLRDRGLCHVDGLSKNQEPYLIAAPILISQGPILGVLTVEAIPFFAFHEENLRNLFSILCYYADSVFSAGQAEVILSRFPQCPIPFASEYLRLHRLFSETGLQSILACRVTTQEIHGKNHPSGMEATLPSSIGARSIDQIWIQLLPNGQMALFVLMPLLSTAQGRLALGRIQFPAGQDWVFPLSGKNPMAAISDAWTEINQTSFSLPFVP